MNNNTPLCGTTVSGVHFAAGRAPRARESCTGVCQRVCGLV